MCYLCSSISHHRNACTNSDQELIIDKNGDTDVHTEVAEISQLVQVKRKRKKKPNKKEKDKTIEQNQNLSNTLIVDATTETCDGCCMTEERFKQVIDSIQYA